MDKQLIKDSFGWGFFLWIIGYILGFIFFAVVPPSVIGWVIMPIGIALTLWVLTKKIKQDKFKNYLVIGTIWVLIAVVCDYLFLVKLLKPENYYKLDVYVYYVTAFLLPVIIGKIKTK